MHAVTVAGHRGASNLNESYTISDHDVKALYLDPYYVLHDYCYYVLALYIYTLQPTTLRTWLCYCNTT